MFCLLTGVKFSCCAEIVFFRATSTAVYLWPLTRPTKSNTTCTWRAGVTLCFFSYYSLPSLFMYARHRNRTSTQRCHQLHINILLHSRYTFYQSIKLKCITSPILFLFELQEHWWKTNFVIFYSPSCLSLTQKAGGPGMMECISICDIMAWSHERLMWQGKVIMSASGQTNNPDPSRRPLLVHRKPVVLIGSHRFRVIISHCNQSLERWRVAKLFTIIFIFLFKGIKGNKEW